jgi:hypothetical protein
MAGLLAAATTSSSGGEPVLETLDGLRQDIATLNLLNGLHLTDEQEVALLGEARRAERLRERYRREYATRMAEAEERFRELREQLLNPDLPPEADVEHRAKEAKDEIERIRESFKRELANIEERVNDILTAGQRQIVEEFAPCLIPPKSLRDPVRVGQANDSSHLEQLLVRCRSMSDREYERRMEGMLGKHISRLEVHFGALSDEDRESERERVRSIIDECRAMSDVEFEIHKEELVGRLAARAEEERAKQVRAMPLCGRGKAARFLLSDRIIPILEQRTVMVSAAVQSNP